MSIRSGQMMKKDHTHLTHNARIDPSVVNLDSCTKRASNMNILSNGEFGCSDLIDVAIPQPCVIQYV